MHENQSSISKKKKQPFRICGPAGDRLEYGDFGEGDPEQVDHSHGEGGEHVEKLAHEAAAPPAHQARGGELAQHQLLGQHLLDVLLPLHRKALPVKY